MGYWDIPDGEDCAKKTWLTTRAATVVGLVGSAYYIILFQPKTLLEGLRNAGDATLTLASLGAIFGVTSCITAQVREKPEDELNYFIGGCTAGAFLGIKRRHFGSGLTSCVAFGTLAAFTKVSKREGWLFMPSEP